MRFSSRYFGLLLVSILVFVILVNTSYSASYTKLSYKIDHSQAPPLYYNDVTIKIRVGQTSSIVVMSEEESLPYRYDTNLGELIVTTDGDSLDIYVADALISSEFGTYEVTALYDDKSWAWSHGFDDNVLFGESVDAYKALGYQATVFIIGDIVHPTRTEYWILDASSGLESGRWVTGIKELAELEWGIGNHGWGSSCDEGGDFEGEILYNNQKLLEMIAASNNPSYKPIAFAAPCFLSGYHPILLDLRNNGVTRVEFKDIPFYLLFNESGNKEAPYIVDSNIDYAVDGITAYAFDFNSAISRDYQIEYAPLEVKENLDWMSAHADGTKHYWYNTLAHGSNNGSVISVLNYVHENYGRAGTNEAWIAPSERIYSYLINKERVVVSFLGYQAETPPVDLSYHPYGAVILDGMRASNGVEVTGFVPESSGIVETTRNYYNLGNGAVRFELDGTNGDLVSYGIDGYEIAETAVFAAGKLEQVDLTNRPFSYDETQTINGVGSTTFFAHDRNSSLRIDANGYDLGTTQVSIRANQACTTYPGETVKRCFNITPKNSSGQSATLTFYFYNSQIPEGQSCEDMEVYNHHGSQWTVLTRDSNFGVYGRSCQPEPYTTPHAIQVSGVTDFSPFVIAQSVPTAVTLDTFTLNTGGNWQSISLLCVLLLIFFTVVLYWRFKQE